MTETNPIGSSAKRIGKVPDLQKSHLVHFGDLGLGPNYSWVNSCKSWGYTDDLVIFRRSTILRRGPCSDMFFGVGTFWLQVII